MRHHRPPLRRPYYALSDIDEGNVEAALSGRPVRLTVGERKRAVDILTSRGYSGYRVGEILGLHVRTVQRYRRGDRHILLAGVSSNQTPREETT